MAKRLKLKKAALERLAAAKRAKPKAIAQSAKMTQVTVTLRHRHTINAVPYGPGSVTVRRPIAELLMEQERNADRENARFTDHNPDGRVIGPRRKVIRVDPSRLDTVMAQDWALSGSV